MAGRPWVLAATLSTMSVAIPRAAHTAPPVAAAACPKGAPCDTSPSAGQAGLSHVIAAAGSDNAVLAAMSLEGWNGLRKRVAAVYPRELRGALPLLAVENPWTVLQVALGLRDLESATTAPAVAGWDRKRPLLLSLVDGVSANPIEQINSIIFDGARLPMHVRVIVPATNADALAEDLRAMLSKRPLYGTGASGCYLLKLSSYHLAVVVNAADDYVRLELLYFASLDSREGDKAEMLRQLEQTDLAYKSRSDVGAMTATDLLLADHHGVVLGFRPTVLARHLELEAPAKVMSAVPHIDANYKARIIAEGLAEILRGHLLIHSGDTEIAEAALGMDFDRGIRAVGLAQLTPLGQKQMAVLVNGSANPVKLPNTLASMAITLQPGGDLKMAQSNLGPALDGLSVEQLHNAFRDAGTMGWPVAFAKPVGFLRKVLNDGAHGKVTELPQDVTLDLLGFDRRQEPNYRLRANVPSAVAPTWATLAQLLAQASASVAKVKEQPSSIGTWITWSYGEERPETSAPPKERSGLPNGTFASAQVDFDIIATALSRQDPDRTEEDVQVWRQLGRAQLFMRLQESCLVGEFRAAGAVPSAMPNVDALAPVAPANAPHLEVLNQAIVEASELLHSLGGEAIDRAAMVAQGRAKLRTILDQAKRDPASRAEAAALDRMLMKLEKMFRANPDRRRR